jgi:hypothetical protein
MLQAITPTPGFYWPGDFTGRGILLAGGFYWPGDFTGRGILLAGVAALFNAIDRGASSTGSPLEDAMAENSVEFRDILGINHFYSAEGKF